MTHRAPEHPIQHLACATKHLNVLEGAELVAVVWRGREKLHYLNPVPLHAICERWVANELKKGLES